MNSLLSTTHYLWTRHAHDKMRFYGLSESRVRRVIKTPARVEEGIAENTIAAMQPASYKMKDGQRTWSQEIWVMFRTVSIPSQKEGGSGTKSIKIISAWRYPGKTKEGASLPSAILDEIQEGLDGD
jgi:hypothetical protein